LTTSPDLPAYAPVAPAPVPASSLNDFTHHFGANESQAAVHSIWQVMHYLHNYNSQFPYT